jgi:hypothetical protein
MNPKPEVFVLLYHKGESLVMTRLEPRGALELAKAPRFQMVIVDNEHLSMRLNVVCEKAWTQKGIELTLKYVDKLMSTWV